MKYRVYDTSKQKYVTDDPCWVLKPDGRLAYNDYGDEIGYPDCIIELSSEIPDLNDVEVYDGDIVKLLKDQIESVVIYHKGCFFVGNTTLFSAVFSGRLKGTVIGNIHDFE